MKNYNFILYGGFMKTLIYGRKNTKTGEWYVGKTTKTLDERAGIGRM